MVNPKDIWQAPCSSRTDLAVHKYGLGRLRRNGLQTVYQTQPRSSITCDADGNFLHADYQTGPRTFTRWTAYWRTMSRPMYWVGRKSNSANQVKPPEFGMQCELEAVGQWILQRRFLTTRRRMLFPCLCGGLSCSTAVLYTRSRMNLQSGTNISKSKVNEKDDCHQRPHTHTQ